MLIVLDSGFCVLQGLLELRKRGVFSSAVIKKRGYLPKLVSGRTMNVRVEMKEVRETDGIQGLLDETPFLLFVMKEVKINTKIKARDGSLDIHADAKEKKRKVDNATKMFRYKEPFHNHYACRHCVDDHNNKQHSDISLEETWMTHPWQNGVFAFLVAITEVILFLLCRYFVWEKDQGMPLLQFRRLLAISFHL